MTILTAIDTDESAGTVVETGHDLATGLGEDHIVIHVASSATNEQRRRATIEAVVRDALGNDELPEIALVEEGSVWEGDAPSDRVADRIIGRAGDADVEYVVIGSRKHSPTGKAILGNVAQLVLINSSTPVVVVEEPP